MNQFRMSKYSPVKRDASGTFIGGDWTSVSDIGANFDGHLLSPEAVEDAYVETLLAVHARVGAPGLQAITVEPSTGETTVAGRRSLSLANDRDIELDEVGPIIRGCLREQFWCRLRASAGYFWIHFGYELYVYFGTELPEEEIVVPPCLHLERFASPYAVRTSGDG